VDTGELPKGCLALSHAWSRNCWPVIMGHRPKYLHLNGEFNGESPARNQKDATASAPGAAAVQQRYAALPHFGQYDPARKHVNPRWILHFRHQKVCSLMILRQQPQMIAAII